MTVASTTKRWLVGVVLVKDSRDRLVCKSHMTNSRLTDPEVLEARYPVRLERFGIRSG